MDPAHVGPADARRRQAVFRTDVTGERLQLRVAPQLDKVPGIKLSRGAEERRDLIVLLLFLAGEELQNRDPEEPRYFVEVFDRPSSLSNSMAGRTARYFRVARKLGVVEGMSYL